MSAEPIVQVGQLWKHRKNGRIVRVTGYEGESIFWESVTKMPGRNTGIRGYGYWTENFQPYTETTKEN